MKICLVNASHPNGANNDSYVDFRNYELYKDSKWRSWHSIPCSLGTEFFAYNGFNFNNCYKYDGIILLFNHKPDHLIPFVKKLKMMGKKVATGYHESWEDFLSKASHDFKWLESAKKLVQESDFYLNVCPSYNKEFSLIFNKKSIPTYHAAPFGQYDNLKKEKEKRNGVMVYTRTFNQRIKRNTLWAAIEAEQYAKENNTFFTLVLEDVGLSIPKFENIKLINGPLEYNDWLKLISDHRFIYSRCEGSTLGQPSLDAALVGVPAFGGNGENNRLTDSCISIFDIEYEGDYNNKVSILENICSMSAVSTNIIEAFFNA